MRFYQTAAPDQHASGYLIGGEPVTLLNLTPHGTVHFYLPKIELELETRFNDGERRMHLPPNLHTIILEPDLMRVSMVWHSAIECHAKVYKLDHTRVQLRTMENTDADEEIGDLLALE